VSTPHEVAAIKLGRPIMNTRTFTTAFGIILVGACLAAGGASAQTAMEPMKKSDSMKMEGMKADPMKTDTMKTDAMAAGSMGKTKTDCMHKGGMEKDQMKKSQMMKHCDAMK
jgi:pentapeptide MXKDX repeat protein